VTELDQLEMDLLAAADVWFSKGLHMKLQRLIAIARQGERAQAMIEKHHTEDGEVHRIVARYDG